MQGGGYLRLPLAEIDALAGRCSYKLETRRRILPTLQHYDLRQRLSEVEVPVLMITGRHDWSTSVRQAVELVARLPHGLLVIFEDSGHCPFIEEATRFLDVVRAWLAVHLSDPTPTGGVAESTRGG